MIFSLNHQKCRPEHIRAAGLGASTLGEHIISGAKGGRGTCQARGKRKIHAFGVALQTADLFLPLAALPAGIREDQIVHIVMAAYLPHHHGNPSFLYLDST